MLVSAHPLDAHGSSAHARAKGVRRRRPRLRARCGRNSRNLRCRGSARSRVAHSIIEASWSLSQCVACEALQHVILPSLISTTAHDGPIEPWVWMAKSYVAAMRFGTSASALVASPTLDVTASLLTLSAANVIPEARPLRQPFPFRPSRLQLTRGLDGAPFGRRDDAEEIAFAHDLYETRNVAHRGFVDTLKAGAHCQRADHAAVQHSGDAEILHVT